MQRRLAAQRVESVGTVSFAGRVRRFDRLQAERASRKSPTPETNLQAQSPGAENVFRQGMRVGIIDGIFASTSDNLAGPYLSLYALALGASHTQIGLVTALPALIGTGLQIPAAWMIERLKRRKLLTVIGGMGARIAWLPIALIPLFQLNPASAVSFFILLLTIRSAFGAVSTPAWTSLIADVTPRGLRGSYFAKRNILVTIAALAATFASSTVLRIFAEPVGYQVTFGLACLFGVAASLSFTRFPDLDLIAQIESDDSVHPTRKTKKPKRSTSNQGVRWTEVFRKEPAFVSFALMSVVWNFGVNLPMPLFAVHFVETLGGSAGFWGVVSGSTFVTTILGQRYWGPLTDRFGGKNVMVAAGLIPAIIPALWLGAFRPEHGVIINLISGFGWAGYNLAAFNLLLEVTPDARRTMYVAAYNSLIGLSQFFGPLTGGVLADIIGVKTVFALSTALRLIGWTLLVYRVRTIFDTPFVWKDYIRTPRGGFKRFFLELRHLPSALIRRVRVRLQEAKLRKKAKARLEQKRPE